MNYEFFIIACEENIVYGIAYTLKQVIHWEVNRDSNEMKIHNGIVRGSFEKELNKYLRSLEDEIEAGRFNYSDERLDYAARILTDVEERKKAYLGHE